MIAYKVHEVNLLNWVDHIILTTETPCWTQRPCNQTTLWAREKNVNIKFSELLIFLYRLKGRRVFFPMCDRVQSSEDQFVKLSKSHDIDDWHSFLSTTPLQSNNAMGSKKQKRQHMFNELLLKAKRSRASCPFVRSSAFKATHWVVSQWDSVQEGFHSVYNVPGRTTTRARKKNTTSNLYWGLKQVACFSQRAIVYRLPTKWVSS